MFRNFFGIQKYFSRDVDWMNFAEVPDPYYPENASLVTIPRKLLEDLYAEGHKYGLKFLLAAWIYGFFWWNQIWVTGFFDSEMNKRVVLWFLGHPRLSGRFVRWHLQWHLALEAGFLEGAHPGRRRNTESPGFRPLVRMPGRR